MRFLTNKELYIEVDNMCKFCFEESEWILSTEYDRNVRVDIGIL